MAISCNLRVPQISSQSGQQSHTDKHETIPFVQSFISQLTVLAYGCLSV